MVPSRSTGSPDLLARAGSGILLLLLLGCTTIPPLTEADRAELLRVPVVPLVVRRGPGDEAGIGSAVVLSERELLLTPHQHEGATQECKIDGVVTTYRVEQTCDARKDPGGWSIIRLADPIAPAAPIEFDFDGEIPVKSPVYVITFRPYGGGRERETRDEAKAIFPGIL